MKGHKINQNREDVKSSEKKVNDRVGMRKICLSWQALPLAEESSWRKGVNVLGKIKVL